MPHFAENKAVRACNALNCMQRAVGIKRYARARLTFGIDVLRRDLPVSCKFLNDALGGNEFALAVGNRYCVLVAVFALRKPWRKYARDPCPDVG